MNVHATFPPPESGHTHAKASVVLRRMVEDGDSEKVSIGDMLKAFGERAYGLVMIVLCLPNMVPNPYIGSLFGIPLLIVALQLATGRLRPQLPGFIERRAIKRSRLLVCIDKLEPRLRWIESVLKPRMVHLFSPTMDRIIGWFVACLACTIIIPLPGTNFAPALSVIIIALAVAEEDGRVLGLGVLLGLASLLYASLLVGALTYHGPSMLGSLFGF